MEEIVERLVTIGPIAQMVREAPDNLQQPVREKVIAAVSPFMTPSPASPSTANSGKSPPLAERPAALVTPEGRCSYGIIRAN